MQREEITIEHDGKTYVGTYVVKGKMITVSAANGSKSTQLGGLPPERLAKMLLSELAIGNTR